MMITPGYAPAPDGVSQATLLSGPSDPLGIWRIFNLDSPVNRIFSVFMKPETGSRDLVLQVNGVNTTFNPSNAKPLPGGWFECLVESVLPAGPTNFRILLGAGSGSVLVFGFMFSDVPGAYIPTGSSAASITDYRTISGGIVSFASPPQAGDQLYWKGWYEYEPKFFLSTIASQYANSPRLLSIIRSVSDAIDPAKFDQQFFDLIMSIPTANSHGLDIWGRIVGISRTVQFSNPEGEYFGFADGFYPFNERPFSGAGSGSDTWELSNEAYRELILFKALSNIVYATAPSINALMRAMFDKPAYFLITGHMEARYVFEFELSPYQRHIVYNADILPRPCGVLISIIINADTDGIFGFSGSGLQPFNQGVFFDASA